MSTGRAAGPDAVTLEILFAGGPKRWAAYRTPLAMALAEAGVDARLTDVADDPAAVDVIVIAPGGIEDFRPYGRLRAVLSLWAGVEGIVDNPTLTVPLCRMVDPALTASMTQYVCGHVLRHHLDIDRDLAGQHGRWEQRFVPLAAERPVTVLGLGALGRAAATALAALGFPVTGWSRTPRNRLAGVRCLAGEAALGEALKGAQIVVGLLPHTPATDGLMDARRLALLPAGAVLINPGRGGLIDEAALLAALESGHVGHATLDVFRTEPLPPEHPFWAHPKVTVTPHIAAETRPDTASAVIAENVRRLASGAPLLHVVERTRGY